MFVDLVWDPFNKEVIVAKVLSKELYTSGLWRSLWLTCYLKRHHDCSIFYFTYYILIIAFISKLNDSTTVEKNNIKRASGCGCEKKMYCHVATRQFPKILIFWGQYVYKLCQAQKTTFFALDLLMYTTARSIAPFAFTGSE